MTTAEQQPPSEWQRISSATSLVGAVADALGTVRRLGADELPSWVTDLGLPAGWHAGRLAGNACPPMRLAAYGIQSDGGFDGCETIAAFGFTGRLPDGLVADNADRTLRDLEAVGIETTVLDVPAVAGAVAIRSCGYFAAGGLWLWAQHNHFVREFDGGAGGLVVQQVIVVESSRRAALDGDVTALGTALHAAFVEAIGDQLSGRPGSWASTVSAAAVPLAVRASQQNHGHVFLSANPST